MHAWYCVGKAPDYTGATHVWLRSHSTCLAGHKGQPSLLEGLTTYTPCHHSPLAIPALCPLSSGFFKINGLTPAEVVPWRPRTLYVHDFHNRTVGSQPRRIGLLG